MAIYKWNNSIVSLWGVNAVYKGTNLVRPAWRPWVNTYIYYPFTSNLVDQMWNWNTWTMTWTCTFDSSTGIHVTWRSNNYVTWMSLGVNNRNTFTLNVWVKLDNTTDNWQCIIWYTSNIISNQARKLELWTSNPWIDCVICYWGWGDNSIVRPSSKDTNWHNYCLVWDGTKYQWYYDGVALWSAINTSSALNNISELQLWWGWVYWSWRSANWYIKDYIVETVAWTEAQVLSYYNQTKSLYWL